MVWNKPEDNQKNNDPWKDESKSSSAKNGSLLSKLEALFKKRSSNSNESFNFTFFIGLAVIAAIIIWGLSGFYTVNQSERGVVTRFGKVKNEIIQPGLSWKPSLIDKVYIVDTQGTRNFTVHGFMITAGENLVYVEMDVQYRINNPIKYLFNVTNVEDSLRQAADSALRTEVGSTNMDAILTDGRALLEAKTKEELVNIISNYDIGINIVDLNFQSVRPPEQVEAAYDDAIKAREDREREINKAKADKVQLVHQADGRAAKILAEANAYRVRLELEAEGDVARFKELLPQYQLAPELTKERLYIETMEKILSRTKKVIVNEKSGNVMILPLDKFLQQSNKEDNADNNAKKDSNNGYDMNFSSTPFSKESTKTQVSTTNEKEQNNVIRNAPTMRTSRR